MRHKRSITRRFGLNFLFDTCDVMYYWSISLLPAIVLDDLFAIYSIYFNNSLFLQTNFLDTILIIVLIYLYC